MNSFYQRNKPIFVIGFLISLIFIGIIIFYKIKPHKETGMSEVKDETLYKVIDTEQEIYENNLYFNIDGKTPEQQDFIDTPKEPKVDEKYGIREISYTDSGFSPGITKAYLGQTVRWTNNSDKIIYLHQRKPTYERFLNLIEIRPGETFNFEMSVLGLWTYEENQSKNFGSIEVLNPPAQVTQE